MGFNPEFSIQNVRVVRLLTNYLGCNLGDMVCSPLRYDVRPSFHVYNGKDGMQVFYDFGTKKSGNIISLHRLLNHVDTNTACKQLLDWDGISPVAQVSKTAQKPNSSSRHTVLIGTRTNNPVIMSNYMQATGLDIPEWVVDQLYMYVDAQNNLCYQTLAGSFHVRGGYVTKLGRNFAGWVGNPAPSVCGDLDSGKWFVFEGIGDFLASLQLLKLKNYGFVILNSVSMVNLAIDYLKGKQTTEINLMLDNDSAGDVATMKFREAFSFSSDERSFYKKYGDLKEFWDVCNKR